MEPKSKELLQSMYMICDKVAEVGNAREKLELDEEIRFSDILKLDLLCYLAYLAASDGVISWNESRFISKLLDINLTPNRLSSIIEEKNIYSTEFEHRPPIMMQIFVAFDNAIYDSDASAIIGDELGELGDALFKIYICVTKELVESNGRTTDDMDPEENKNVQAFLGMLQNYIEENTEKHHSDVIVNFTKNDCHKSENGVKAPEKNRGQSQSVKAPRKRA